METSSSGKTEQLCFSSGGILWASSPRARMCRVSKARTWGHSWTWMDKFCCWSQDSSFWRMACGDSSLACGDSLRASVWLAPGSTWQSVPTQPQPASLIHLVRTIFPILCFSQKQMSIHACLDWSQRRNVALYLPCLAMFHYVSVCTLRIGCLNTNPCKQAKWGLKDLGISCCL